MLLTTDLVVPLGCLGRLSFSGGLQIFAFSHSTPVLSVRPFAWRLFPGASRYGVEFSGVLESVGFGLAVLDLMLFD